MIPEATLAKEVVICYARIVMATDNDYWMEHEDASSAGGVFKSMKENGNKAKS